MRIYWCEKHRASSDEGGPCKQAHVLAYRTGGNPFEPNRCRIVQRLLVDPSSLPEHAVEAAKESIYDQNLAAEIVLPNGASEGFVGLTELECELVAEAALAAAWEVIENG